jgi:Spy/CpxP family protein refolding chaperone
MEKLMNKTRILIWAIVALAIFNIATIATVFWRFNEGRRPFHREPSEMMLPPGPMIGQMIKEKLHLTEKQAVSFDSIENKFKTNGKDIFEKMRGLRSEMIEEITSENPDSSQLFKLTKELGDLHISLKMNTFDFYFSMKKVCMPEQQKELSNIFRGMFLFEGMPSVGRNIGHHFMTDGDGPKRECREEIGPPDSMSRPEMKDYPKDRHNPNDMEHKHKRPGKKEHQQNQ